MTDKIYSIDEIKKIISPIASRYGVERVFLFGSYARGEATEESDLDFRIDKGALRGLFQLGGLYSDLEERFDKKLDLLTTGSLEQKFLDRIASEEILVYGH
ncbi:nucleotidyltransferase domain-containing protein [Acutalibacter muris]|uniref:Nucleotidyltransferase n=1 Tax=Acutalibacter muris TaxID=1796620 RepID=A0A1Z2XSI0_9FIRM|nr:nucleotidyltransferase domain-containing protein [Acutalibacter muris]ANU55434.1 nucleotidyltransferase [Hungateiclostridiaceae bacterium KB18]ASB41331.1 nucleotidyltransferase [Acutalibacter muris]QQR30596.1 nucleotidyltransferase domain-containing protein [Acutalibacter muris]